MSNFFLQYPDSGIQKYSSFSAFPSVAADGALALAKDTDILYAYSAGSASWVEIGGPGSVLSVGTIDSTTASSNGAAIVADALIMQSASTSKPGLVNNTTQSMSGAKTFTTSVAAPSVLLNGSVSGVLTHTVPSAVTPYSLQWPASQAGGATFLKNDGSGGLSWASGTGASGVDSVGTINSQAKSADAAVISGTTIYFQTADATNPGQVSTAAQTFAGTKTFANIIDSGLTASTVPYADASKQLTSSAVTPTELGYVSGVTSAIQTQLDSKQTTLTIGNLTDVGTDGIVVSGGTGAVIGTGASIAQHVADSTHNGYLSSTDWSTFNGKGAGSVTSVALSVPSVLSISGSPVTTSGTLAIGYSGTALPIANGGTAVTSVTTAPAATSFAGWDASKNLSANNHIEGFTTTATAAGTTTLLVGSTYQQYFTGSTTQTVVMPVATTLVNGQQFQIVNLSSGVVTVQTSGSNTIQAMAANTSLLVTCVNTAGGTGTASWSWEYGQYQSTVLPVNLGGTGDSSLTAYAVLCGGTTSTGAIQSIAAVGSSGNVLTSNGAGALPTFQALTASPTVTIVSRTSNYNAVANDYIKVDASGGAFTVTLPTAVGISGQSINIKRTDLTVANQVTVSTTSSQTMDGVTSMKIWDQYEEIEYTSDNVNWQITYHYSPFRGSVWLTGTPATGQGSTNTAIRIFKNTVANNTPHVTYATSATLGDTFTINSDGIYSAVYGDGTSVAGSMAITNNCTQLSTAPDSLTTASQLWSGVGQCTSVLMVSNVFFCAAGDVLRAQKASLNNSTDTRVSFRIMKVGF